MSQVRLQQVPETSVVSPWVQIQQAWPVERITAITSTPYWPSSLDPSSWIFPVAHITYSQSLGYREFLQQGFTFSPPGSVLSRNRHISRAFWLPLQCPATQKLLSFLRLSSAHLDGVLPKARHAAPVLAAIVDLAFPPGGLPTRWGGALRRVTPSTPRPCHGPFNRHSAVRVLP